MGRAHGGGILLHWIDWWLRGINRVFGKNLSLSNYAFGHVNATAPHPIPKQRACSAFPRSSNFAGRHGLGHGVLCDVFYLTWGIGVFVGVDGLGFHYGAVGCGDSDRKYRPRPWARNWPNREF